MLDIPLLFETGGEKRADVIAVVTAPKDVQKQRVLARGQMTEAEFEAILARQTPDSVKQARADFVINTSSASLRRGAGRRDHRGAAHTDKEPPPSRTRHARSRLRHRNHRPRPPIRRPHRRGRLHRAGQSSAHRPRVPDLHQSRHARFPKATVRITGITNETLRDKSVSSILMSSMR